MFLLESGGDTKQELTKCLKLKLNLTNDELIQMITQLKTRYYRTGGSNISTVNYMFGDNQKNISVGFVDQIKKHFDTMHEQVNNSFRLFVSYGSFSLTLQSS